MAEGYETVFRFKANGVDLEFAGTEEFVEKQLARFRPFLESAISQVAPDAAKALAAAASPGGEGDESLEDFYRARPIREGRGAIQDHILLFMYYLQDRQGKPSVSKEDITFCFQQVGRAVPKNLLNALGNMKRKLGYLQGGGRRGLYQLAPKGQQYVQERWPSA